MNLFKDRWRHDIYRVNYEEVDYEDVVVQCMNNFTCGKLSGANNLATANNGCKVFTVTQVFVNQAFRLASY